MNKESVVGKAAAAALWSKVKNSSGSVNRNMLDNWYFVDPINRQGKDNYAASSEAIYTIDRWRIESGSTLYVNSTGVRVTSNKWMQQIVRASLSSLIGQKLTLSLLYDVGFDTFTVNVDGTAATKQTAFGGNLKIEPLDNKIGFTITQGSGNTIFKAAKLEIGDKQTLAHEEGNIWVLNEIPNWAEQYQICRSYDAKSGDFLEWSFIGN